MALSKVPAPTLSRRLFSTLIRVGVRFSNLALIMPGRIDINKPLLDFGVDSMIASEFWAWF
ncbi:hypothetical protein F5Y19DRAFT_477127 [Xylariaceae sp. FL1651]|nr:hypothetical protein F5Y19DRAFT_477127 [Xylariaceae sp. FL1651]